MRALRPIVLLAAAAELLVAPAAPAHASASRHCNLSIANYTYAFGGGSGVDYSEVSESVLGESPTSAVSVTMSFLCRLVDWVPGENLGFSGRLDLALPAVLGSSQQVSWGCSFASVRSLNVAANFFNEPPNAPVLNGDSLECSYGILYSDSNSLAFLVNGHTYRITYTVTLRYNWEFTPEPTGLTGSATVPLTAANNPRSTSPDTDPSSYFVCWEIAAAAPSC